MHKEKMLEPVAEFQIGAKSLDVSCAQRHRGIYRKLTTAHRLRLACLRCTDVRRVLRQPLHEFTVREDLANQQVVIFAGFSRRSTSALH
jgi:hypothetical protein